MNPETLFQDAVDDLREQGSLYAREAYLFLVGALSETVRALPADRLADADRRHLSGRELVAGVVRFGREEFGPLAPVVFREWGVRSTEDLGVMVFQLVDAGQLSARPEDSMADFRCGVDLLEQLAVPTPPPGAAAGKQAPGE
jgi:uncharacterized repeat protein (TIGR04138 family)